MFTGRMKIPRPLKFLIFLCLGFAVLSCASTDGEIKFSHSAVLEGDSQELAHSKITMDGTETYEFYFVLKKNVQCLRISLTCRSLPDTFTGKTRMLRAYFLLERLIDISDYNSNGNYASTPLGKNYDEDWNHKSTIIVCSSAEDPLARFVQGDLYRVRFSLFKNKEPFTFKAALDTENKATLLLKPPKNHLPALTEEKKD